MKLVPRNAGVAAAVEVEDKTVHQFKESLLVYVFAQRIEPVNFIAAHHFVLQYHGGVAGACTAQLLVVVKAQQVLFQQSAEGLA